MGDSAKGHVFIFFYNVLSFLGLLLAFPYLLTIILTSRKRKKNILARLGVQSYPQFTGRRPIWVHALSVGEVKSVLPLLRHLRDQYQDHAVVLSVSTVTGFDTAKKEAMPHVDGLFYFPLDLLWSVRRTVKKVRPSIFFLVESDIWPNALFELYRKAVPILVVNGRVSPRSFAGYRRVRFLMRALFSWVSVVCAQSRLDAERFFALGAPEDKVTITGSIKFDQEIPNLSHEGLTALRDTLHLPNDAMVFVAGSTHDGEERYICEAYARLKRDVEDLVLVVVPRDPDRGEQVCRLFKRSGLHATLWSRLRKTPSTFSPSVVVVDEMGVLGRLYFLAHVAFVGGSLVPCGGHNPLEPAAAEIPVLFGPHMTDFPAMARMLTASQGAREVRDSNALYGTVLPLLQDDSMAREMGMRAFAVFEENKGAVRRTLTIARTYLTP